jgi:hypothetical protein
MSSRSHFSEALLTVSLALVLLGCAGSQSSSQQSTPSTGIDETRARECNDLVTIINRGVQNIDQIGDGGAEMSGSELQAMASILENAAVEASRVSLTLPALQKRAQDYRDMASRAAAAARNLAVAMQANDSAQIESATIAFQSAADPEERVIRAVNSYCEAP